jgi:hypothetical protein
MAGRERQANEQSTIKAKSGRRTNAGMAHLQEDWRNVALWVSEERLQPASCAIHTPRWNQFSKDLILVRRLVLYEVAAFGIHFFPLAVVQVVAMLVANLLANSTPVNAYSDKTVERRVVVKNAASL